MFIVDINKQTNIIQVKTNNEDNFIIVAEANYIIDEPDFTVLILFKYINIEADNHQELEQFLSTVLSEIGNFFKTFSTFRLPPIFDNRIDFNKLETKNKVSWFMCVTLDTLKYDPSNNLLDKLEHYELITDRELILNYAEQLLVMMNRDTFWATKWKLEKMCKQINSATNNAMILDKINNVPCGFGRLLLLTTDHGIFGYLSDIIVATSHQSKGLGTVLVNYFVGISISQNKEQQNINGTLCLQCADIGSGALSAPKLYKRFGFEYVNDIGNRTAIFANRDHSIKTFN